MVEKLPKIFLDKLTNFTRISPSQTEIVLKFSMPFHSRNVFMNDPNSIFSSRSIFPESKFGPECRRWESTAYYLHVRGSMTSIWDLCRKIANKDVNVCANRFISNTLMNNLYVKIGEQRFTFHSLLTSNWLLSVYVKCEMRDRGNPNEHLFTIW